MKITIKKIKADALQDNFEKFKNKIEKRLVKAMKIFNNQFSETMKENNFKRKP